MAAVHSKVHWHSAIRTTAQAGYPRELCKPPTGSRPQRPARIRRRDRHGRGLRGVLVPPDVPLHRTRAERFDDLVLQAVARLEPQWEAHLSGIEFAVEEIPPAESPVTGPPGRCRCPGWSRARPRPGRAVKTPAGRARHTGDGGRGRGARIRRASWCTGGR